MILQRTLNYLLINIEEDKTSIAYKKAKTLCVVLIISLLLVALLISKIIIVDGFIPAIIPIIILFMIMVMLAIIKSGKYQLAGNILSLSLLFIMIFSMIANPKGANIPYFLVGHYYVFFVIIFLSAMFATRAILLITSLAVIISTSYIYFASIELIPANIKDISEYGFFLYEVSIVLSFMLSFIFTNFK